MYEQVDLRQRVVQALEEVINERGTAGLSVSLIARTAQLNPGLLYRSIGGVADLLDYYLRQSPSFPHFPAGSLAQLRLVHGRHVDRICSGQLLQFFRQLRTSKASREVLQASMGGHGLLAETLEQTQHKELMGLVGQLPLSASASSAATWAIMLGGLYYLTSMAHNDQPMLGIDLRSESGWLQIEEAIRVIYHKLN